MCRERLRHVPHEWLFLSAAFSRDCGVGGQARPWLDWFPMALPLGSSRRFANLTFSWQSL